MLGIRKVDTTFLSHKEFWIDCFLGGIGSVIDLAEHMLGLLSLGRLTADWGMYWFRLTFKERDKF